MLSKLFELVKQYQYQIFMGICVLLISFISYNLGKINARGADSVKISEGADVYKAAVWSEPGSDSAVASQSAETVQPTPKITPKPLDLRVVASKSSKTKKYFYTWCGTWKRITQANQIWFNTAAEAEAAGYSLAGNCSK